MSEHLPECFASLCECDDTHFKSTDCDFSCICHSLRACEQRVLDAAREALVGMNPAAYLHMPRVDAGQTLVFLADALAAIDALKEQP